MKKVSSLLILLGVVFALESCSGSTPVDFSQSSNGIPDGLAGAPAGTPQYPNLLSAYAVRPAWNVAGVDYAVGVPAGLVLKDPTIDALPLGCSYSSPIVTCAGNNITVQGYNFALNSTKLYFSSGTNIVITTVDPSVKTIMHRV